MRAVVNELKSGGTNRNYSVDFVKGILVLAMIIYHALNFSRINSIFDIYLHFIASGFIFVTGFITTNITYPKYLQKPRMLGSKLIIRGLKLVTTFILLNILINLLFKQNYGDRQLGLITFFQNAFSIFIIGNGRIAAFEILLSIGYLLLLSPLLLLGVKANKFFLFTIAIILIFTCSLMPIFKMYSSILIDITFGVIGLMFGQIHTKTINSFFKNRQLFIIFHFIIYVSVTTFLNLPYYILVLWCTLSMLSIFYLIGNSIHENSIVLIKICQIGRYSLFGYIIQIAIFQVIIRGSVFMFNARPLFYITLITGFFLTILSIVILDILKKRFRIVESVYKIIFT